MTTFETSLDHPKAKLLMAIEECREGVAQMGRRLEEMGSERRTQLAELKGLLEQFLPNQAPRQTLEEREDSGIQANVEEHADIEISEPFDMSGKDGKLQVEEVTAEIKSCEKDLDISKEKKEGNQISHSKNLVPNSILYTTCNKPNNKLSLTPRSDNHYVIHISQLKKPTNGEQTVKGYNRGYRMKSVEICTRYLIQRNKEPVAQLWVKWINTACKDSSWEDYYSYLILEGKNQLMEEGMSRTLIELRIKMREGSGQGANRREAKGTGQGFESDGRPGSTTVQIEEEKKTGSSLNLKSGQINPNGPHTLKVSTDRSQSRAEINAGIS